MARIQVAPHTGAWIEIKVVEEGRALITIVAPHTGAWIEIVNLSKPRSMALVAPHTGAWIEILAPENKTVNPRSRTPYGCVD